MCLIEIVCCFDWIPFALLSVCVYKVPRLGVVCMCVWKGRGWAERLEAGEDNDNDYKMIHPLMRSI